MSLQTGGKLGSTNEPVINPEDLSILAYTINGPKLSSNSSVLRVDDIREIGKMGVIVDSHEELIDIDDLINVKNTRELGFKLIGMKVIDESGHKLGKVDDYVVDNSNFLIQQLSVKKGVFGSITDTGKLIDRSQIVEINNDHILVKSTAKKIEPVSQSERRSFENPFRQQEEPQPEAKNLA